MSEAMAAFFGAVVGVGALIIRDWIAHLAAERQRATYLAIRVVNALDPFVDACAVVSLDDGHLEPSNGEAQATTEAPPAPSFPDDLDWRSIRPRLAFDILSLESKVANAKKDVSIASDYASPPDYDEYFAARCRAYTTLGLEAARLARELRDTHHLPRRTFANWNAEEILADRQRQLEREDREQQEEARRNAAAWLG